ncbi:hypothetical protein M427DRAFT_504233 [Gonapodya prolifera JEL478]|uniref:Uncharacterized protein n=1 Tax=Gonapodya prolifera (strain JEL478) TaxID=1344416 RepID=A0A139A5L1_GONPJ|nr:hypothetical protein M427DRAFT_504233 [Gonapodya prolifera JEL478]|eukprot:KXS11755.1 hypothetical protein M427DRAFT_504233 [Gonapodya prolifera JEL478]
MPVRSAHEKLPWWIYFVDLPEAVPLTATIGATVWFVKSPYGALVLKHLKVKFPDKGKMAYEMIFTTKAKVSATVVFSLLILCTLLDALKWPKFLYQFKLQLTNWVYNRYINWPAYTRSGAIETIDEVPTVKDAARDVLIAEACSGFTFPTGSCINPASRSGLTRTTTCTKPRSQQQAHGLYSGFPLFDWLFGTGTEYFQWRLEYFKTHQWITNLPLKGVSEEALKALG